MALFLNENVQVSRLRGALVQVQEGRRAPPVGGPFLDFGAEEL